MKLSKSFLVITLFLFTIVSYGGPFNPPDSVPIDGGLTALLVAGGAMGYRAMKKKKKEEL